MNRAITYFDPKKENKKKSSIMVTGLYVEDTNQHLDY